MEGKTISHYRILEKLGEGGMGEVYLAEDIKLKRKVALKFLPREYTKDQDAKERFQREAQAAAALNHPNIVTIHEINEHEDQTYIAMEYVEGKTLKDKIASGPLPLADTVKITSQICEGLQKAHDAGIVHRDIKPQNIIINKDGKVKILDFGLAKLKGVSQLTRESSTLGTVHYMSPEQAKGGELDNRSDIWSLGVVLYEMVTGQLPFKGDYDQAIVYSILNEKPEPVTGLNSSVSMDLEQIIAKLLSKKPSERYLHVDDLMVDLKNINERSKKDITETKREIVRDKKLQIKKYILPIILLLTIIVVIGGYFIFKGKKEEPLSQTISKTEKITETKWKNSIAVLPFADISKKKDQEWFCDGMTEDILSKLARIDELKVISRTSVLQYKHTKKTIKTIGAELGVKTVLEGSIRKSGDRIRVTAQLINVSDDTHLWADTFDRKLENVFDLQDEVSKAIAQALKLKFAPDQLKIEQSRNVEAYENFLQYRYQINMYLLTQKDEYFNQIVTLFRKAIDSDRDNAIIHASLGYAYNTRYNLKEAPEDLQLSIKHFKKAYLLNPDLGGTNAAMAYIYSLQKEHQKSVLYLKKALKLDSNLSETNHIAGFILYRVGLYNKALPYFKKAGKLNPLYLYTPYMAARTLINLRQFNEANSFLEKSSQLAPENISVLVASAELNMKIERLDKAEKLLAKASKINPEESFLMANKAFLFALKKNVQKSLELHLDDDWYNGQLYSLLDKKDKAFEYLSEGSEKAYLRLKNNLFYKNLRMDPRYQKISDKLKGKYDEFLKIFKDI